ncbi:MAG: TIR domain-containing protein [Pseudomonadota bacterium]
MADVFISYARKDRGLVEPLARALATRGYSVWWDRDLKAGNPFSEEIERELRAAKHVVVCWSENARRSNWVKDEATIAARAETLKAISLDGAEPPMGYMQFHTVDFASWKGGENEVPLEGLLAAFAGNPVEAGAEVSAKGVGKPARSRLVPVGLFLLLLLGMGAAWWAGRTERAAGERESAAAVPAAAARAYQSIAVLAFEDLSPAGDQGYFSDGIAAELLNLLARETDLRVASRTSSFYFKDKDAQLSEIATALNVETVLEGSVRRAGDQVRIQAQLVDATTGKSLWGAQFDRELANIFAVQDEVAQAISRALTADAGVNATFRSATTDAETYDLYLRAQYQFQQRGRGVATAQSLVEQATERDPAFAPAWALLAMTKMFQYRRASRVTQAEFVMSAKPHIDLALDLDPQLAEAHVAEAYFQRAQGDTLASISAYRRALEINPNVPDARHLLYIVLVNAGAWRESFDVIDEAAVVDPLSPSMGSNYVYSLMRRGRGVDALAEAQRRATKFPDYAHGQTVLSRAYQYNGELAEAARVQVENWETTRQPRFQMQSAIFLSDLKLLDFELPEQAPVSGRAFRELLRGNPGRAAALLLAEQNANPEGFQVDPWSGEVLWWAGEEAAAHEFFSEALESGQIDQQLARENTCDFSLTAAALFLRAGEKEKAEPLLVVCGGRQVNRRTQGVELIEDPDEYVQFLVLTGQIDEAFEELDRLVDKNRLYHWWFHLNPVYDPVREDPRFTAAVQRLAQRAEDEREKYLARRLKQ